MRSRLHLQPARERFGMMDDLFSAERAVRCTDGRTYA